jgi:hypothetical protein
MAKFSSNLAANAAANGEIGNFPADFMATIPWSQGKKRTACPKARGLVNLASIGR